MSKEKRPALIITAQASRASEWVQSAWDHSDKWVPYAAPLIQTTSNQVYIADDEVKKADWIMFTSQTAVEVFFSTINTAVLQNYTGKWAVVGSKTKLALESHGVIPDFVPTLYSRKLLVTEFLETNNVPQRILFPRGNKANLDTIETLQLAGHKVNELVLYKTVEQDNSSQLNDIIQNHSATYLFFASPTAVTSFVRQAHKITIPTLHQLFFIPIGDTTAEALTAKELPVLFVPSNFTFLHALSELQQFLRS
ncbi:uroporphyrinogen-III synthase [Mangrovibacillus cuniculi]|uniref:Uroporphyrinogen-III synthase n=1 Tax=Mangrovibacillus cuniculi TaxID=2593652 RepID=A0A7S8HG42_9BACI|nr:uroporphyrinogen-III synthase [Mangrovibacillus cuniculi]QPC47075.1 uroporphyrinogen-III synthase [Mangrovibacillus cuniculi]